MMAHCISQEASMRAKHFCVLTTTDYIGKIRASKMHLSPPVAWGAYQYGGGSVDAYILFIAAPIVGILCMVLVLLCSALSVVTSLAIILMRKKGTGYSACFVFLISCHYYCYMTLPRDSVSLSAVCDCGVSWPYSLTFCTSDFKFYLVCEKY